MDSGSIFVLSGEDLSFPSAEIKSLVESYAPKERCEIWGKRVVHATLSDIPAIQRIAERAAYCRFGGELLARSESPEFENLERELKIADGKTFAVESETLEREICGEVGAKIKSITNARVSLEQPDYLFDVERIDSGGLALGLCRMGRKSFSWRKRRPRARRFFLPSAIYPKLARLLVNLSRVKEGDLFLDPFCGTGSLVIECAVMGIEAIGMDLGRWVAKGALSNLKGFDLKDTEIIRSDSTKIFPLRHAEAISTDVPYGRAASTRGKDTKTIMKEFTTSLAELFSESKSARYAVIMHPLHVELEFDRHSFQLQETHSFYVHRSLTRAISVLKTRR